MVCKCCNLKVESDCESQVLLTCTGIESKQIKERPEAILPKSKVSNGEVYRWLRDYNRLQS